MRLAVAGMVLAACTHDSIEIKPGIIIGYGESEAVIHVPGSLIAGSPFVVGIDSTGDGCYELERTDVELSPDAADVFPLDRVYVGDDGEGTNPCPVIGLTFNHEATVTFDEPGTKSLRFHGRQVFLGDHFEARDVIVVSSIEVTAGIN